MELRFEDTPFDHISEDDPWLRCPVSAGLISLEGSDERAGNVVVPNHVLWMNTKYAERWRIKKAMQAARADISNPRDSRRPDEAPPQPVEFLERLRRRQDRERASLVKVGNFLVPLALRHLAERVESSQSVVGASDDDGDDDDEEVNEGTWLRAAHYVLKVSTAFWRARKITPPMPTISAGPDGSVDVVWRHRHRSLLLNVPEEPESVVTFSGLDRQYPDARFRGEEDLAGNGQWLLGWLVR